MTDQTPVTQQAPVPDRVGHDEAAQIVENDDALRAAGQDDPEDAATDEEARGTDA